MKTLPVQGGREWPIAGILLAELSMAFPKLDVMAQIPKARAWLVTHESQMKTTRGMPKFLWTWMSNADKDRIAVESKQAPAGQVQELAQAVRRKREAR